MCVPLIGVGGFLPSIQKYAVIGLVAILALGGVYVKGRFDGAAKVEAQYEKEKLTWQVNVATTQGILDTKTDDIFGKYALGNTVTVEKIKYIKSAPVIIDHWIPAEYNNKCEMPKGMVDIHNKAADNATLDELKDIPADYGVPSGKKPSELMSTVSINYLEYNRMKDQLKALQATVREFQEKQEALVK